MGDKIGDKCIQDWMIDTLLRPWRNRERKLHVYVKEREGSCNMKKKILRSIRDHENLMSFLSVIYRAFMLNSVKKHKGLKILGGGVFC